MMKNRDKEYCKTWAACWQLPSTFVIYTYDAWNNMKQRCYNKNNPHYKSYGARGITVADEWRNSYKDFAFYVWDNLGPRAAKLSMNRIDNDKGYQPGNIKYSTQQEQIINRDGPRSELGMKHIRKVNQIKPYYVQIVRNYKHAVSIYCATLEEAIEIRDKFLAGEQNG